MPSLYLRLYNWTQVTLWTIGLFVLISSKFLPQLSSHRNLNLYFITVQSLMVLDIVHVLLRLTPGDFLTTLLQVASRLYLAWFILPAQPAISRWNYVMFTAWSLAEIIRYFYYNVPTLKTLTFLRYSAFLVLYPLGVLTGELPLVWEHFQNAKALGQKRVWIDVGMLIGYVPGFPYLFLHMIKLRKKKLAKTPKVE
jgi:very-long-chain (3R)-3-hydroxyacyl-CoA dehydratase